MQSPSFSFQAEDGIRAYKVTGVQTCALPISRGGRQGTLEQGACPDLAPTGARGLSGRVCPGVDAKRRQRWQLFPQSVDDEIGRASGRARGRRRARGGAQTTKTTERARDRYGD